MRYILLSLLTLLSVVGYAQDGDVAATKEPAKRYLLDRVIAVVGNSSILLSDVAGATQRIVDNQKSSGYTSERNPSDEALEGLMTQKLLYSQALVDSVEISLADISTRVEQQINDMSVALGGIRAMEESQNMEIFNIREILHQDNERDAYAQEMKRTVMSRVTIVPGEVERYYKSRSKGDLPMIGEQYRYAQITRLPDNMEQAKRRVKERLLEMREKIINGEARFTSLAQMYSVDPGSSYRGGEMEPQPAHAFVSEFADMLESLQPGQVSEVVETQFGFHIIELIEVRNGLYHCRHILLRPEYTTEEYMGPINFLDSLANEIRRDTITFEKAALQYSDDDGSKMNGGIVSNHDMLERYNATDPKLTVTKFLKEDFGTMGYKSLDDYNALMNLQVGEVSDAFATEDLLGNPISKIVKLVEIYPAHEASLEGDYIRLEGMALQEKQAQVFEEWITEKISSTYVYLDPEFRDADFLYSGWVK